MNVDPGFAAQVARGAPFDAGACLNCGSCTALCPLGLAGFPRRLFRYAVLGAREKVVAEAETVYSCLLCKMCEENCPAGVHITDNVRALRVFLGREEFGLATGEV